MSGYIVLIARACRCTCMYMHALELEEMVVMNWLHYLLLFIIVNIWCFYFHLFLLINLWSIYGYILLVISQINYFENASASTGKLVVMKTNYLINVRNMYALLMNCVEYSAFFMLISISIFWKQCRHIASLGLQKQALF